MPVQETNGVESAIAGNEPEGVRGFYGLMVLHVVLAIPALLLSEVIYDVKDWREFPVDHNSMLSLSIVSALASPVIGLLTFANKRMVLLQKLILLVISFTGVVAMLYFLTQVADAMRF